MVSRALVGISGWTYPNWRGDFYPAGLVHRRELEYAAERLTSIEVNGSFYALQRPTSYRRWFAETPDRFVFSVKGGRFITHLRRLREVEGPVATFFASGILALGHKLGPILWQLPPTFEFDRLRLETFLRLLPHTHADAAVLATNDDRLADDHRLTTVTHDGPMRHAVEVRHPSLATSEALDLFRSYGVAVVVADSAGHWPEVHAPTADFVYVRLHGAEQLYASGYTEPALQTWRDRIRGWLGAGLDVYAYFDNDIKVRAPFDAQRLIALLDTP